MNAERGFFWFRLFKARGMGPIRLNLSAEVIETEHLCPETLSLDNQRELSAQSSKLAKILNGKIRAEDKDRINTEYRQLKMEGVEILYPTHPDLPPHLLEITPVLIIKGRRKLLTADGVAIVGARNVSDTATRIARRLAGNLANMELNVVSGYAKGVDFEAHFGALSEGGTTTIVLPYGIKEFRQKSEFKEFDWQENVLAVSQFDPRSRWREYNAMMRNKLICTLSKAVVVIESGPERDAQGKMSGTFNTAQTALSMEMPLFVINPECFDNPPKGNADLIGLGGKCLDSDGAAGTIYDHIFAAERKPHRIERQSSPKQLELW